MLQLIEEVAEALREADPEQYEGIAQRLEPAQERLLRALKRENSRKALESIRMYSEALNHLVEFFGDPDDRHLDQALETAREAHHLLEQGDDADRGWLSGS